jgi:hypothetical protein
MNFFDSPEVLAVLKLVLELLIFFRLLFSNIKLLVKHSSGILNLIQSYCSITFGKISRAINLSLVSIPFNILHNK